MTTESGRPNAQAGKKLAEKQRLAEALRANLRRRKAAAGRANATPDRSSGEGASVLSRGDKQRG